MSFAHCISPAFVIMQELCRDYSCFFFTFHALKQRKINLHVTSWTERFPVSTSTHPPETNLDTKTPEAHVKRSILVRTVETRDGEVWALPEQHSLFNTLTLKRASLHIAPIPSWGQCWTLLQVFTHIHCGSAHLMPYAAADAHQRFVCFAIFNSNPFFFSDH